MDGQCQGKHLLTKPHPPQDRLESILELHVRARIRAIYIIIYIRARVGARESLGFGTP